MIVKKEKLINKVKDDGYGSNRRCRICGQDIDARDIVDKNFEYSKNQKTRVENFFHTDCVKNEIERMKESARKGTREKVS